MKGDAVVCTSRQLVSEGAGRDELAAVPFAIALSLW